MPLLHNPPRSPLLRSRRLFFLLFLFRLFLRRGFRLLTRRRRWLRFGRRRRARRGSLRLGRWSRSWLGRFWLRPARFGPVCLGSSGLWTSRLGRRPFRCRRWAIRLRTVWLLRPFILLRRGRSIHRLSRRPIHFARSSRTLTRLVRGGLIRCRLIPRTVAHRITRRRLARSPSILRSARMTRRRSRRFSWRRDFDHRLCSWSSGRTQALHLLRRDWLARMRGQRLLLFC